MNSIQFATRPVARVGASIAVPADYPGVLPDREETTVGQGISSVLMG